MYTSCHPCFVKERGKLIQNTSNLLNNHGSHRDWEKINTGKLKNSGKVGEICQSEKVGTMSEYNHLTNKLQQTGCENKVNDRHVKIFVVTLV